MSIQDRTEASRDELQEALGRLGMYALQAPDLSRLMREALDLIREVLGVDFCDIWQLSEEGKRLHLIGGFGWRQGLIGNLSISLGDSTRIRQTLLGNDAVIIANRDEVGEKVDRLLEDHGVVSSISVPVPRRVRPLGVLGAHTKKQRTFTKEEELFLRAVAFILGVAIERKQSQQERVELLSRELKARQESEAARRRLSFLAEAGEVLASSLDYSTTLANIARLAVPRITDWCTIFILEEGKPVKVAVTHVDQEKIKWANELYARYPVKFDRQHGIGHVLSTGKSELVREVPERVLQELAEDEEHLQMLRSIGIVSYMVVPLRARGRTLGAISFISSESGRRYDKNDLVLAEELAHRAALAMDNARLYEEAKEIKNSLYESRERLNALIKASPLPIISVNMDSRVTEWNPAAERVFGWKREEVIGQRNPTVPQDEKTKAESKELVEALLAGKQVDKPATRRLRKDGSLVDVHIFVGPVRDVSGKVVGGIAVLVDITERMRFLQIAAHELGNPMAVIKALCSYLRAQEAAISAPELKKPLATLEREIDNFFSLLGKTFDAFRIREGHLPLVRNRVDLVEIIDLALHPFQVSHNEYEFEFNKPGMRVFIKGDFGRLGEVMRNLIQNAVKYSPPGSKIAIDLTAQDGMVTVSIADQGCGIPADEQDKIFEGFYRASNVQKQKNGGMGLGLYICRDIINRHDGRIWLESEEGRGTVVYVEMPLLEVASRRK